MKKLLLKTMLLLCALVAGMSSAWAETYTIDFESESSDYSDWTFNNATTQQTNIAAHGGSYIGTTGGKESAFIQTKDKIANPTSIVFYISKASNNNTASSWYVKVSTDGTNWTTVGDAQSASSGITKGTWTEVTRDLSSYHNVYVKIEYSGTTAVRCIDDVTLTYSSSAPDPVAVTGVSLNKTSLELEVDGTETLTATVAPNNASNKGVTWTSSDEDVATVENGVVTAKAVGNATITVKSAEDGSKTATCAVTVTAAPVATALLDFTTNDWGISASPTKTIDATDFTSGGYTVTIEGSTGNGYYFDNDNIMIGKQGASLTLPAFPFNVKKIKVYGTDGASGSVTFNIFVDETAVSTEVTSSKITHEFIINTENQAAGNRYKIKVTNAANMRIAKIEVFGYMPATITSAGYATLFTPVALDFSGVDGLTAYTAVKDGNVVRLTQVSDVQANTGVVLEGAEGTYSIPAIATSTTAKGELVGNATAATAWNAESGYTYYVLASTGSGVEFRPVSEGEIAAGKAFLRVADGSVHGYSVAFGDETGISEAVSDVKAGAIYDLSGRRVVKPTRGLYIVNGKKIMVK